MEDKQKIASWTSNAFWRLIENLKHAYHYTNMLSGAISIIASDEFAQLVSERKNLDSIFSHEKIGGIIEKAKQEKENAFGQIIEHAIVSQFAYLEAAIKQFITEIFLHQPSLFNDDAVGKIKIELIEYRRKSDQELADYFFKKYEEHFGRELYGVKRFEKLLEPVGLNGEVEPSIRETIFEQAQVRNLLLHKNGIADQDFTQRCRQLGYSVGQKISISSDKLNDYIIANTQYGSTIINRVFALITAMHSDQVE